MQNFWGVNKMFYGRCKNGEYVNNFILIFLLLLFFNFTLQKCAINIWQDFFRSESFQELLCAIFFFSNGFDTHLLYTVNSPLTNTSLDGQPSGVGPCHCPVI